MITKRVLLICFSALTFIDAQAVTWDGKAVCEKIQVCVTEQIHKEMQSEQLPPGVMEMAQAQVSGMCQAMNSSYNVASAQADQVKKCMNKILSASCEELMAGDGIPECDAIE